MSAAAAGAAVDWHEVGRKMAGDAREGTVLGYAGVLADWAAHPEETESEFPDRLAAIACAFDDAREERLGEIDGDVALARGWVVVEVFDGGGAWMVASGLTRREAEIRAGQENRISELCAVPSRFEAKASPKASPKARPKGRAV